MSMNFIGVMILSVVVINLSWLMRLNDACCYDNVLFGGFALGVLGVFMALSDIHNEHDVETPLILEDKEQ